jgi:hypothetical protein
LSVDVFAGVCFDSDVFVDVFVGDVFVSDVLT